MPNGLYRQTRSGKTGDRPIERIHLEKIESNGKPDFSVVYASRIEFLRTTAVAALSVTLSTDEIGQLEELYQPHSLPEVMTSCG
jgi:hypothetical protein